MDNFNSEVLPFRRFYWVIPGMFLAGHVPSDKKIKISHQKITRLIKTGIRAFINLQEENEVNEEGNKFYDYSTSINKYAIDNNIGIDFHRFPIKDLSIPEIETMKMILHTIENSISNKKPVYVHCWGGIGRTGTVVGCFLMENSFANKNNVLNMIKYLRRTDPKNHRNSPETQEQIEYVLNWKK